MTGPTAPSLPQHRGLAEENQSHKLNAELRCADKIQIQSFSVPADRNLAQSFKEVTTKGSLTSLNTLITLIVECVQAVLIKLCPFFHLVLQETTMHTQTHTP